MKKLFFVALLSSLAIGSARADNPDLMTLIGTGSAATAHAIITGTGNDAFHNASTYNLSTSDYNSFAVDYGSAGVIRGHGRCSTRAGDSGTWDNDTYNVISGNFVDSLTDETGQTGAYYCYCRIDSYTPSGGTVQNLSGPWVYGDTEYPEDACRETCGMSCANWLRIVDEPALLAFRTAVFNAYAPGTSGGASGTSSVVTTQTYVDKALNAKQAKITTTGTNKLMTFGSSAGNIGTKDIVSTLGTSTTATTVPEVGPIVTGLNGKQNTVNGTANYVMTGTGTAGTVGEKPVYSATNNYDTALVTAQTINTAAANAANSELSCVDNDCLLWQINTSGPAGISTRIYLNASINGSGGICARTLRTGENLNYYGGCEAGTITKVADWGTVFSYGQIKGISSCSTFSMGYNGDYKVATNQTQVQNDYRTSVTTNPPGTNCFCKLVSPELPNAQWVQNWTSGSKPTCAENCAIECASGAKNYIAMREALFGMSD